MKYWLVSLLLCLGCQEKPESNLFSDGKELGTVSKKLKEASGLVASRTNPNYFWTLNDSGNPAEVYLINDHAEIVMTCLLANIKNRDWEDITVGAGPEPGKNYLYVGDIGDNDARYPYKIIYRFVEPLLSGDKLTITEFETFAFQLSDGVRDTEAVMTDPITNDFFIFSKREDSIRLYQLPYPWLVGDTLTAELKSTLPFSRIVAANISADGSEVLIKNYDQIYYWKRSGDEPIPELLQKKAIQLTYTREPQGESIAWKLDGSGFYTLSETVKDFKGKLLYYKRK
ncbi:MAG: hypothetical protein KBF45_13230 [Cyclobacteriaceae bacterium]|jgi:hypothetical protein|nr:hypothetical protein [Cyclobacteriaceae bacterium]